MTPDTTKPKRTTSVKPKRTTSVNVKNGMATVFMHSDVGAVTSAGQTFERPSNIKERTWSFECSPELARDIVERYEFAGGSESGVPLTLDEKRAVEDLKSKANIESGKLASALASIAEDHVRKSEAAGTGS